MSKKKITNRDKSERDKDYQRIFEMLVGIIKVTNPNITEEQASNVVINIVNWKQLQRLKND